MEFLTNLMLGNGTKEEHNRTIMTLVVDLLRNVTYTRYEPIGEGAGWERKGNGHLLTTRIAVNVYVVMVLFLTGSFGNILSSVVLGKDRKKQNCTKWLQALAVTDTLYSVASVSILTIPTIQRDTDWWPALRGYYAYIEKHAWPVASIVQMIAIWMILLITIDRYLVTHKPLETHTRRLIPVKIAVPLICVWAVVFNIPAFLETEVVEIAPGHVT